MSETVIVGIDPGASGGIAFWRNETVTAGKMPKGTDALNAYFSELRSENENVIVFLEIVSHYAGGGDDAPGKKFAIAKMMNQYQELKTLLSINKLPYVEVHSATWQGNVGKRVKGETKKQRKDKYKAFAIENYPTLKVTLNTSDALCILSFGRSKMKHDRAWVLDRLPKNIDQQRLFINN